MRGFQNFDGSLLDRLANHEQPEDRGPRRLDRDPLAKFCELILAFVIANIHWQKLVMHQMSIIGLVPL